MVVHFYVKLSHYKNTCWLAINFKYEMFLISMKMTENIKDEKVFIKEDISTEEDTSTVYLKEEDVKMKITEIKGCPLIL